MKGECRAKRLQRQWATKQPIDCQNAFAKHVANESWATYDYFGVTFIFLSMPKCMQCWTVFKALAIVSILLN